MSYDANPNMVGHYGASHPTYVDDTRVVVLTQLGERRVLNGVAGTCFIVDSSTPSVRPDGQPNVHVRDYRYPNDAYPANHPRRFFSIWTLGQYDYEAVPAQVRREL